MILLWLILLPFLGGILAWGGGAVFGAAFARWTSAAVLAIGLVLSALLWSTAGSGGERWIAAWSVPWIPSHGIALRLAADGLSVVLVALTFFLGLLSVVASWRSVEHAAGFFHFNLLWILAGTAGVFLATDLVLFFFLWELMVLPMFFLIAVWGHENRVYAAVKFFIFTQASGLLLLAAILGLHFAHAAQTGERTFDYEALLGHGVTGAAAVWLMLGFFAAFAVKLPAFPFHTWLADAHSEAPTAGSIILAGVLLKTGAYGLIRFVLPLFPAEAAAFAPVAMAMGAAGVLYGAMLAFAQTDLKRLIACSSVSHMGFVLLGVFALNEAGVQGTVMQLVCHGLSTGGLFILAGILYERLHTRDMRAMGGFWRNAPRMGAMALLFAMASLGLPGLGNFVAEFLILFGTFVVSPAAAAVAALGLLGAALYSLRFFQDVFQGNAPDEGAPGAKLTDLVPREAIVLAVLAAGLVFLGLYPRPVLDLSADTSAGAIAPQTTRITSPETTP